MRQSYYLLFRQRCYWELFYFVYFPLNVSFLKFLSLLLFFAVRFQEKALVDELRGECAKLNRNTVQQILNVETNCYSVSFSVLEPCHQYLCMLEVLLQECLLLLQVKCLQMQICLVHQDDCAEIVSEVIYYVKEKKSV